MSGVASCPSDVTRRMSAVSPAPPAGAYDRAIVELCEKLFASLPRADQRRKGTDYVRGLLETHGRKSIRNIAAVFPGQAPDQSLHHFVSASTWDWLPVRRALAQQLLQRIDTQAWVVRSMVIPKAGRKSVGVDRRFIPAFGQALNAQQAIGVWAAGAGRSGPVNWRLHLPQVWLDDGDRRSQAAIPKDASLETLGDCAIEACREMSVQWGLSPRPIVLDGRELDTPATIRRFRSVGMPLLVRVGGTLPLSVADPALTGYGARVLPAEQIMGAARSLRRPVMGTDHAPAAGMRGNHLAAVNVRPPAGSTGAGHASPGETMLLVGVGRAGQRWPQELWLTDLSSARPSDLLRLSGLLERVDHDFAQVTSQVGIRDYAGRSFGGWHRHATLASIAHAVAVLTGAPPGPGKAPRPRHPDPSDTSENTVRQSA